MGDLALLIPGYAALRSTLTIGWVLSTDPLLNSSTSPDGTKPVERYKPTAASLAVVTESATDSQPLTLAQAVMQSRNDLAIPFPLASGDTHI